MTFETNRITCPHCGTEFEHNKINGVALMEAASNIEKQKRVYCRLSLDALERLEENNNLKFPSAKKVLLDNFNDFTRAVHTIIGFGRDAE